MLTTYIFTALVLGVLPNHPLVYACSPPRSKHGEFSVKRRPLIKRAQEAEIVVIATVINIEPESVKFAVHYKLKGNRTVARTIDVTGFGKDTSHYRFYLQASADCTDTNVALYGDYIMFLKYQHGARIAYRVHEVGFQSAVTQIKCRRNFPKKVEKLMKHYRRNQPENTWCYDSKNRRTLNNWKRCLKAKTVKRILENYKLSPGQLNPRTYYCRVKMQLTRPWQPAETTRRPEMRMKDFVVRADNTYDGAAPFPTQKIAARNNVNLQTALLNNDKNKTIENESTSLRRHGNKRSKYVNISGDVYILREESYVLRKVYKIEKYSSYKDNNDRRQPQYQKSVENSSNSSGNSFLFTMCCFLIARLTLL